MLVTDVVAAAFTALFFSALFAVAIRFSGPKLKGSVLGGLAALFCVLFVATWAGGLWMPALGPSAWGVPWLSFFVVGMMVAVIVAAAAAPHAFSSRVSGTAPRINPSPPSIIVVSTYFWLAIVLLLLVVVAAYAT